MRIDPVIREIYAHAERGRPHECCGVVTQALTVVPLENVSPNPSRHFELAPQDYLTYVKDALFVYHSHPDGAAIASDGDMDFVERIRKPLLIVSWPEGALRMLGDINGMPKYEGRPFIFGVFDCYTVLKDFYSREFGIKLPQFTRPRFGWWLTNTIDPLTESTQAAGFVEIPAHEMQYGDGILLAVIGSDVANHIAVYVGGNYILHHGAFALSGKEVYDAYYREHTVGVFRHVDRS